MVSNHLKQHIYAILISFVEGVCVIFFIHYTTGWFLVSAVVANHPEGGLTANETH